MAYDTAHKMGLKPNCASRLPVNCIGRDGRVGAKDSMFRAIVTGAHTSVDVAGASGAGALTDLKDARKVWTRNTGPVLPELLSASLSRAKGAKIKFGSGVLPEHLWNLPFEEELR